MIKLSYIKAIQILVDKLNNPAIITDNDLIVFTGIEELKDYYTSKKLQNSIILNKDGIQFNSIEEFYEENKFNSSS